jgi:hypothetical protein
MFIDESLWISSQLKKILDDNSLDSLLNVGSSSKFFREISQPFIYNNIFKPIQSFLNITHLDLKKVEGVDIVGDLADSNFFEHKINKTYDIVLCSNLLEHVTNVSNMCAGTRKCTSSQVEIRIP